MSGLTASSFQGMSLGSDNDGLAITTSRVLTAREHATKALSPGRHRAGGSGSPGGSNDWPIVAVAAVGGRVALANMAGTVLRATATEEALAGGVSIAEAAELADQGTSPGADMHADAEYRRHLAQLLTRRALERAAGGPASG